MDDTKEKINNESLGIKIEELPYWGSLPELELYMDQVIILLNRYFSVIGNGDGENETITKNMINNYVKMKVVPPPVKKKYSKTHIAYLIIVCFMKQMFSISMIKRLLPDFDDEERIREMYNGFVRYLQNASDDAIEKYSAVVNNDKNDAAIRMAAESVVLKILAERLI